MRTTIEMTRKEFLNLKDGKKEGYSELDGRYFQRLGDKAIQQKQLDAIITGKSKNVVFLMEVNVSPAFITAIKISSPMIPNYEPPEIKMTIREATLVEEHAKTIKLSVIPKDFLRNKHIKFEAEV